MNNKAELDRSWEELVKLRQSAVNRGREHGPVKLLSVAMSAKAPSRLSDRDYTHGEIPYPTPDGWTVFAFYDGDSLEGVTSFLDPEGRQVRTSGLEEEDPRWMDLVNLGCFTTYPY